MINEKVNENNRKAARTMWMIYYAKSNDCILQICPWQNECQWSVNKSKSCNWGNYKLNWSWLYVIEALAAFIGNNTSDTLHTASWKWASTKHQRFLGLHPAQSDRRWVADSHKGIIGHLHTKKRQRYCPCPSWKWASTDYQRFLVLHLR